MPEVKDPSVLSLPTITPMPGIEQPLIKQECRQSSWAKMLLRSLNELSLLFSFRGCPFFCASKDDPLKATFFHQICQHSRVRGESADQVANLSFYADVAYLFSSFWCLMLLPDSCFGSEEQGTPALSTSIQFLLTEFLQILTGPPDCLRGSKDRGRLPDNVYWNTNCISGIDPQQK